MPEWFWLMPAPLTLNTYSYQGKKNEKKTRGPHVAAFTDTDTLAQLHSYELPSS